MRDLFGKYGELNEMKILINGMGKSKGMGFVGFEDSNAAIRALKELDNRINFGRILHIERCRAREIVNEVQVRE